MQELATWKDRAEDLEKTRAGWVEHCRMISDYADKRTKEVEDKLAQTEAVRVPPTHTHLAWRVSATCHLPASSRPRRSDSFTTT